MFMEKMPFEEGELDTYFQEAKSISPSKKDHDEVVNRIQETIGRRPSKVWKFMLSSMRVAFAFSLFLLSGAFVYQNIDNEIIRDVLNFSSKSSEKDIVEEKELIGIHHPDSIKRERVDGKLEWSLTEEGMKHVFLPLHAHEIIDEIVGEPNIWIVRKYGGGVEVHASYPTEKGDDIQLLTKMHNGNEGVKENIDSILYVFPDSGSATTIAGQQAVIAKSGYSPPQLFIVTPKYTYYLMGGEDIEPLIELAEQIDFKREH